MRLILLNIFVLFVGCARIPVIREIASIEPKKIVTRSGKIDYQKSNLQTFPAVEENDNLTYHFYLQLKDTEGEYIDCEASEIVLKTGDNKPISFQFNRFLMGRFYLTLMNANHLDTEHLSIYVRGMPLKQQFNIKRQKPDLSFSKVMLVEQLEHRSVFQLRLADKINQPVEFMDPPEIVLEGNGIIEDLKYLGSGVWAFTVLYPDDNQVMYFSIRANGIYFPRLYRFQYVEK